MPAVDAPAVDLSVAATDDVSLSVNTMAGDVYVVAVQPADSIAAVKARIAAISGVAPSKQSLFILGEENQLSGAATVQAAGLLTGIPLFLTVSNGQTWRFNRKCGQNGSSCEETTVTLDILNSGGHDVTREDLAVKDPDAQPAADFYDINKPTLAPHRQKAFALHGILDAAECAQLIQAAEAEVGFRGLGSVFPQSYRTGQRAVVFSEVRATLVACELPITH